MAVELCIRWPPRPHPRPFRPRPRPRPLAPRATGTGAAALAPMRGSTGSRAWKAAGSVEGEGATGTKTD
eukprot:scaffold22315_cov50-Phaeocystis_antarctica.AAC.2